MSTVLRSAIKTNWRRQSAQNICRIGIKFGKKIEFVKWEFNWRGVELCCRGNYTSTILIPLLCSSQTPTQSRTCKHFISYAFILLIFVGDGRFFPWIKTRTQFQEMTVRQLPGTFLLSKEKEKKLLMHLSLSVNNSSFSELWSVMIMAELGCRLKRPFRGVVFCWLRVEMTVEWFCVPTT